MKFINQKIILVAIILMAGIILLGISKPKDYIKLESVNLRSDKENNMFAIMLEQDDGTYKEDNSNNWPTSGYTYNIDKSGCIDANGKEIENSLSYNTDTKNVSIRTKEASYCYLYFSIPADNLYKLCKNYNNIDECIKNEINNIELVNGIWDSQLEGDGYRYVGTNPNNYICFGTTDKATCTENTDLYMYRIIGLFEDSLGNQHMKLIKKEALNTSYYWHNDSLIDIDWDESDLYNGINGSYFLTNTIYSYMQDNTWVDKITIWNYIMSNTSTYSYEYVRPPYYYDNVPKTIYLYELNRSTKSEQTCYSSSNHLGDCNLGEWKDVLARIGLMYISDYALSLGASMLDMIIRSNYNIFKTGWIHLSNNDPNAPSSYEWTMSRFGDDGYGDFQAWHLINVGSVSESYVFDAYSVRPAFFLDSNIKITSGGGTFTNPYIIG